MLIRALGEGVGVCESFGLRAPELPVRGLHELLSRLFDRGLPD